MISLEKSLKDKKELFMYKTMSFYETYGKDAFNPAFGASLSSNINEQDSLNLEINELKSTIDQLDNQIFEDKRRKDVFEKIKEIGLTAEDAIEYFGIEWDEDNKELTWDDKYIDSY